MQYIKLLKNNAYCIKMLIPLVNACFLWYKKMRTVYFQEKKQIISREADNKHLRHIQKSIHIFMAV